MSGKGFLLTSFFINIYSLFYLYTCSDMIRPFTIINLLILQVLAMAHVYITREKAWTISEIRKRKLKIY